jgi:hypothetical protein
MSFRGAGAAREPGIDGHWLSPALPRPVFLVSGLGSGEPPRNDAFIEIAVFFVSIFMAA